MASGDVTIHEGAGQDISALRDLTSLLAAHQPRSQTTASMVSRPRQLSTVGSCDRGR